MSSRTASAAAVAAVDRRQRLCDVFGEEYDPDSWADWRWQLRHRLTRPEHFERYLELTGAELNGLPQLPVVQLDWSRRSVPGTFDVVLGSELVYREADIVPLQQLFTRLLKPAGEVILAGEVRRVSEGFFRRMKESFHVQVHRKCLRSGPHSTTVLVFRLQPKSQN